MSGAGHAGLCGCIFSDLTALQYRSVIWCCQWEPCRLVLLGDLPEGSDPGLKLRDIKTSSETGVCVYYNPDGGLFYHALPYCPHADKNICASHSDPL